MVAVAIEKIRRDGGTQSRAALDLDTVSDYADAIHDGAPFPPIVVFFDGDGYWLADGFHRFAAHGKLGRHVVECDVRQGTRRDAILYSVGANATHGRPRTNADKRRAVTLLLSDEEWSHRTDAWIADKCAVAARTVGRIREESVRADNVTPDATPKRQARDGKEYTLPKPKPAPVIEPVTEEDDAEPESAPQPIATAPRAEPAPAPVAPTTKPDPTPLPPAGRDVEGERRHLFTLLPTDRRLADALWTVGQLTASERRDLLSRISE